MIKAVEITCLRKNTENFLYRPCQNEEVRAIVNNNMTAPRSNKTKSEMVRARNDRSRTVESSAKEDRELGTVEEAADTERSGSTTSKSGLESNLHGVKNGALQAGSAGDNRPFTIVIPSSTTTKEKG